MIQTELIKSLITIADTRSFSKAAELLYTSQSSLSRLVITLEKQLGVQLFDRQFHPIRLTYCGELYINACREVMAINDSVVSKIADTLVGYSGRVVFGLSRTMSRCITPTIIKQFSTICPNAELTFIEHSSPTLENMILEGAIDLALVAGSKDDARLEYLPIIDEQIILAIPPAVAEKYNLSRNDFKLPEMLHILKDYGFILQTKGRRLREYADDFFTQMHIQPEVVYETDDSDVACQLVNNNIGFTFYSKLIQSFDCGVKPLFWTSLGSYQYLRSYNICRIKNRYHSKAEGALLSIVRSCFINSQKSLT